MVFIPHTKIFKTFAPQLMSGRNKSRYNQGKSVVYTINMWFFTKAGGWETVRDIGEARLVDGQISFTTTKDREKHWFRNYQGYGVNLAIVDQIAKLGDFYRDAWIVVQLPIAGRRGYYDIYRTRPSDWQKSNIYNNPAPPYDEQYIMPFYEMERIAAEIMAQANLRRQRGIQRRRPSSPTQSTLM